MRLDKSPWIALIAACLLMTACTMASQQAPEDALQADKDLSGMSEAEGGFGERGRMAQNAPGAPSAKKAAPAEAPAATLQDEARNEAAEVKENKPKARDASAGLYIIRRASLTVQVENVKKGIRDVTAIARGVGGFVAESAFEASEGGVPNARMVLRVPAEKFDAVLETLDSQVGKVFGRNIDSDDVTMEYVDTTSRIKNLKQEESTLLKLLQRSGKLSEVLEMERELSRVRGQIEQAQGRLRHLGNLVSLATIEVALSEKVQVVSTSPWGQIPAALENAWRDVERSLAGALTWLLATGAWVLGYYLPLALPLIALYLIAGWALRGWLIERRKFMPEAWFTRFWVGLGLALIAIWWPPLAGLIVLAALAAAVLGAGSLLVGKFFVRKRELD